MTADDRSGIVMADHDNTIVTVTGHRSEHWIPATLKFPRTSTMLQFRIWRS